MRALVVVVVWAAGWPTTAAAQFVDKAVVTGDPAAAAPPVVPVRDLVAGPAAATAADDRDQGRVDLRLTLSSFLHREAGDDAPPWIPDGAAPADASPVRRFFGDARVELAAGGLGGGGSLHLDGRVRQTTSQRYQAGAGSGGEYELRRAAFHLRRGATELRLGRQLVGAVGSTRLDGAALERRWSAVWSTTLFGGATPARGARSLDTDYPALRQLDGSRGAALVPVTAGAALTYRRPTLYGDLGVGGVEVLQDVPGGDPATGRRVFTTARGYWRPAPWFDVHHDGVLDVAGDAGLRLTSASLGLDVYPTAVLRIGADAHHVDTELLEIGARNLLEDSDPALMGVVQNHVAVVRVAQDAARLAASLALARSRFELSAAGSLSRRPAVETPLPDGGVVTFAAATMAEASVALLDRRGPGGLRLALSSSVLRPVGRAAPTRSRGVVARLAVGRSSAGGDLELDVMLERFVDLGPGTGCTTLDAVACYGTATTRAAQAGGLFSRHVAQEWLVLLDVHVGVRDATSTPVGMAVAWPRVRSVTAFARLQWRYR